MKRLLIIVPALLFWVTPVTGTTITDLFNALQEHPVTELDTLQTRASELKNQSVYDRLYPVINGELGYQEFSSPTNWRPVVPTESGRILANNEPLPFSDSLSRMGATLSLPIFVKELFTLGKQTASMIDSAKAKKRLNLLENQAILIASDAHLIHMTSLEKSLIARRASLEKTRADVVMKVNNGRIPETEKIRMDEAITLLNLGYNDTLQQEIDLKKRIESLTSMYLEQPVPLQQNGEISDDTLFALKPIQESMKAKEFGVQAAKDKLYPSIVGSARWFHSYGEGYNTGEDVDGEYGFYGVSIQMPLFNKPTYTAIELAKIELRREKTRLSKTEIELQAQARRLKDSLKLLQSSKDLARKSVENERDLLEVAKISYGSRRMNQEEYLRYEEKVLSAEAKLYLTEARWWETFGTLAVLYGNDLRQLVK